MRPARPDRLRAHPAAGGQRAPGPRQPGRYRGCVPCRPPQGGAPGRAAALHVPAIECRGGHLRLRHGHRQGRRVGGLPLRLSGVPRELLPGGGPGRARRRAIDGAGICPSRRLEGARRLPGSCLSPASRCAGVAQEDRQGKSRRTRLARKPDGQWGCQRSPSEVVDALRRGGTGARLCQLDRELARRRGRGSANGRRSGSFAHREASRPDPPRVRARAGTRPVARHAAVLRPAGMPKIGVVALSW